MRLKENAFEKKKEEFTKGVKKIAGMERGRRKWEVRGCESSARVRSMRMRVCVSYSMMYS